MNLKKFLISIFSAGIFLSSNVSAESPFADAPDWSYQPVSELIAAKLIDGADARNFSKDEIMTRYDMARLVGRAVYKIDRANSDQRKLIERLAEEFSEELDYFKTPLVQKNPEPIEKSPAESEVKSLDVDPVLNHDGLTLDQINQIEEELRKRGKIPPIEIAAYARIRGEYSEHPQNTSNNLDALNVSDLSNGDQSYRYYLYLISHFKNDYKFVARFGHDDTTATDRFGFANPTLHWAALIGDVGHGNRMKLGRQNLMLGYGLGVNVGKAWDGISFDIKRGVTDYRFGAFQRSDWRHRHYWFAGIESKVDKNLEIKANYFHDSSSKKTSAAYYGQGALYHLWTLGAQYRFKDPFTLTAEYGFNQKNDRFDDAHGYYAQLNYQNANLKKPKSWTTWIQYRNADLGFNPMGFTLLDEAFRMGRDVNVNLSAEDVHGWEYGFSYVPFENTLATLKLWDLRRDSDQTQRGGALQIEYLWR